MSSFTFDVPFQRAILRLCMTDEEFAVKVMEHVEPGHFTAEPLGWVYREMKRYWETYGMRCTDLPLRQLVKSLSPEKMLRYGSEVELIIQLGAVAESNYVRHELREFIRRSIFAVAHRESAALFNDGKHDAAYDVMARAQERIVNVDFDAEDRQWFFEELPKRQRIRYRAAVSGEADAFMTGIHELDRMAEGGVHRGELWVVFAYAKRCKTTWLVNQGFHATRVHRQPALHIVLEGSGDQIGARYDACFSQELYTNVKKGEIGSAIYKAMQEDYESLRRLLVIRTMNDWNISVMHIVAETKKLKTLGFAPRMLIVDYMDLLRSRDAVDSETQNQVNAAHDLQRFINQEGLAGWSAWQARRPKEGANNKPHILTSSDVADAYAKVRIVSAYGSLNATDDEMANGSMRVFWEGYRDGQVNKLFLVSNDLSRQRMITTSEIAKPPGASS